MAFDERLAERVRDLIAARGIRFVEKRMMGGLCFMVSGKMCVGIDKNRLMARIDPGIYETALSRKGCTVMDFTGRPMRGFVFVNPAGIKSKKDLDSWIALALEFNPRALASKRKRTVAGKRSGKAKSPSTVHRRKVGNREERKSKRKPSR